MKTIAPRNRVFTSALLELVLLGVLLLLASPARAQQCVAPPSGMVSWYPGDGNADDIADGNDGTLQNGATFAAGMVGQAFSFDGINDFVQIPNAALNNKTAGTIDMWIFPTANGGAGTFGFGRPWFAKQDNNVNSTAVFAFKSPTDSRVRFHLNNQAPNVVGTTPLAFNTWHHVAATWDGSFIRVYVDGVNEVEVASSLGLPLDVNPITSIGAWRGDGNNFFSGLIDEVEIFNRALSAEEIQAIFLAGSAGKCKNQSPDCSAAAASPSVIWPPNHKMVPVTITGVTDPDGDAVTITATSVSQDEAVRETGVGSGNTAPDATLSPLAVRAERNGNPKSPGNGRVYHVNFTADDGNGGSCTGTVKVCVPHDQGKGSACVDGGPLYNSLAP